MEQWEALVHYWVVLSVEDPTHANTHTLKTLQNPLIKSLMYFVDYALGLFNDFNCFIQADYPQFTELKSKTEDLIKTLAFNFMDPSYVKSTPALKIDPLLSKRHIKLEDMYLGVQATSFLEEVENKDEMEMKKLYESVLQFYIEAITQIKTRFIFDDVHSDASFLTPENANNVNPPSVYKIAKKYLPEHVNVNYEELDKDWRSQRLIVTADKSTSTTAYWKNLFEKSEMGKPTFIELPKLVNFFMSLPFSNAGIERVFSSLKTIKTDKRNRLDNETLSALITVKYGLERTRLSSTKILKNLVTIPLGGVYSSATSSQSKDIRLGHEDRETLTKKMKESKK